MLDAHPNLRIPPETHFFARFDPLVLVGRDTLDTDASISRYVKLATSHPNWNDYGVSGDQLNAVIRAGAGDARRLFLWLLTHLTSETPAARIGEKTPRHESYIPRIRELFPDAKFIHIHRDPRDVVLSMANRPWGEQKSLYARAKRCRDVYDRAEHYNRTLPPRCFAQVSCETLIREPERTLRRLCDFLGEPFDAAMLEFHEREHAGFLEREREWKALTTKPLDPTRVGRYKGRLSPYEIRVVEHVVGAHLERLGYTPEPGVRPLSLTWRIRMLTSHAAATAAEYARLAIARLTRCRA